MNPTHKRAALAARVRARELVIAPGVFDMISTRIADRQGHAALYMTGYGTVASYLGLPDAGLASFTDMENRGQTTISLRDMENCAISLCRKSWSVPGFCGFWIRYKARAVICAAM